MRRFVEKVKHLWEFAGRFLVSGFSSRKHAALFALLGKSLGQALVLFSDNSERHEIDDIAFHSWPQDAIERIRGLDGVSWEYPRTIMVTVVVSLPTGVAAVFRDGKHAYTVQEPSGAFWEKVRQHLLPATSWPTLEQDED